MRDGGLEPEDRSVFGEYLALLDYKLSRREDLDGQIEKLAFSPPYKRIAAVAVARELVGFLWAVMQQLEIEQAAGLSAAA